MSNDIKKGLLGIVVDETTISQVMPDINSLTYRGYAVQDLCEKCNFEEVAYLILNKELPNKTKLKNFKKELEARSDITVEIYDSAQLYKDKEVPQAVGSGAIEAGVASIILLTSTFFILNNREQFFQIINYKLCFINQFIKNLVKAVYPYSVITINSPTRNVPSI